MGRWRRQLKLALSAKKNITLDTLLSAQQEQFQLQFEPIIKKTVQRASAQAERDRLTRKVQLKMNWEFDASDKWRLKSFAVINTEQIEGLCR